MQRKDQLGKERARGHDGDLDGMLYFVSAGMAMGRGLF